MSRKDNSLLCSKYVQAILEENEEIRQILGDNEHKIFPLLQPEQLTFPFIVHSRGGVTVTYTKDIQIGHIGWYNEVTYNVSCVSNDYVECLELANATRHAMETYRWKNDEIYIHPIELVNVTEYTTENDAFVQELQFRFIVE